MQHILNSLPLYPVANLHLTQNQIYPKKVLFYSHSSALKMRLCYTKPFTFASTIFFMLKKQFIINCILLLFTAPVLVAQEKDKTTKHTISGYVKDASSGEVLIGANVYLKETLKGMSVNQYGYYSITAEKGTYTLISTFLGFNDFVQTVTLDKDVRININLQNKAIETQEVVITDKKKTEENINSTQMGKVQLDVEQIRAPPAFLGEVDILKTIQYLPGVQSAG